MNVFGFRGRSRMIHRWFGWLAWACMAALLALPQAAWAQPAATPGPFAVESAWLQRTHETDEGFFEIILRNTTSGTLSGVEVTIEGTPAVERRDLLWHLGDGMDVAANGLVRVAFRFLSSDAKDGCHCAVSAANVEGATVVDAFVERNVAVSAVRFSQDLKRVLAYVRNDGESPVALRAFDLHTRDGRRLDLSETVAVGAAVAPGNVGCLVGTLQEPLHWGSEVFLHVSTDDPDADGLWAATQAFPGFPIVFEGGRTLPVPGLDRTELLSYERATVWKAPHGRTGITRVVACPSHHWGSRQRAAAMIVSRCQELHDAGALEGLYPYVHFCRARMLETCYELCPASPMTVFNLASCYSKDSPVDLPEEAGEHVCQFATREIVAAAAPHRVLTVIPFSDVVLRQTTVRQARLFAYYALSRGTTGVLFRGAPSAAGQPEFENLLAELARIAPLAAVAYDLGSAAIKEENVEARAFLVGDYGLLVYAIQHAETAPTDPPVVTAATDGTVAPIEMRLRIPSGLELVKAYQVTPYGELTPIRMYTWDAPKCLAQVYTQEFKDAAAVLLLTEEGVARFCRSAREVTDRLLGGVSR